MTTHFRILQSLRKNAYAKKRPTSTKEKWKTDLVEFLTDSFFKKMLECPTHYTFHEVLMYKDLDRVKNDFTSVNPRAAIDKALVDPHSVLKVARACLCPG